MPISALRAAIALRITVGLLLAIHGVFRVYDQGVGGFGEFLGASHVPLGAAVAWLITAVEIVGGPLLALGLVVRPLCTWFALVLVAGVILVHSKAGWFVVGGGRNGMEYSVLLIVCFVVTAVLHGASRQGPARA